MTVKQKTDAILDRDKKRSYFYGLAIKMFAIAQERGLRLIMENPWSENTYLKANFIIPPSLIDTNRMLRGDYRVKPTAYWYVNCEPTYGQSVQFDKQNEKKTHMTSRGSSVPGVCSEERSMISGDYARNFICDFVLGKKQKNAQMDIFDFVKEETNEPNNRIHLHEDNGDPRQQEPFSIAENSGIQHSD
jgi:hypothetical protein